MSQQPRPTAWRNADRTPSRPFRVTGTADGWPVPQPLHSGGERLTSAPPPATGEAEGRKPQPGTSPHERTV